MPTESGERKAARGQSTGAPPPQETDQALPCPRCDSINTKFCYYNNYNLSQPRYFCKACRRYWTRGGTLRNVPVGGGCRKNSKRSRTASNAASNASTASSGSSSGGGSNPRSDSVYGLDPMALKLQVPAAPVPAEVNLGGNGGSFTSLLGAQGCASSGFLALGGFGLGIGSGFEEMGFGLGRGVWPYQEVGIDGGHDGGGGGGGGGGGFGGAAVATPMGWQLGGGGGGGGGESGFSDADCGFAWPDLGISMSSNGFK